MAQIRHKHDGSTGGGWTPLPEGTYDFRIIEVKQTVSRAGNDQLQLRLEVLDGNHAGEKVSNWYSLTEKSGWKLEQLLSALEIDWEVEGQDTDGNDIRAFEGDDLMFRCVRMDVSQEEWPAGSGKMTNRFNNETLSEYDAVGEDEEPQEAAQPEPAKPPVGRRRPRPPTANA